MKLYHLSRDLDHDGNFYPRFPNNHMDDEFMQEPRICFSTSLGGCLTSIPNGGSQFDQLNLVGLDNEPMGDKFYRKYKLFEIDTEEYGIEDKYITDWETLYERDWVRDAIWTEETWISCPLKISPKDSSIIIIKDWRYNIVDLVPHKIYEEAHNTDGDLQRVWAKYRPDEVGHIPCITLISEVEYEEVKRFQDYMI